MPEVCTEFIPIEEGFPSPGEYLCRVEFKSTGLHYRVLRATKHHHFLDDFDFKLEHMVTHYAKVPTLESTTDFDRS